MSGMCDEEMLAERLEQMALVKRLLSPWPDTCRREMRQAAKALRAVAALRAENERLKEALAGSPLTPPSPEFITRWAAAAGPTEDE